MPHAELVSLSARIASATPAFAGMTELRLDRRSPLGSEECDLSRPARIMLNEGPPPQSGSARMDNVADTPIAQGKGLARSAGALAGLKVVDLTRVLGGPYCTMILSDHGAEGIKVEPPQGDEVRDWGPPFHQG